MTDLVPKETILDTALAAHFDVLNTELKLTAGQAALSQGLRIPLKLHHDALAHDLANITETDPLKVAALYQITRMQMMLVQDMIGFLNYAALYFKQQTQGEQPQPANSEG